MSYPNPINYAHGLLDELEGAERAARQETVVEVRKELAAVTKALNEVDLRALDEDATALLETVKARVSEVLGGSKSAPRTTKAAAAPEKAVPPAAK